MGLCKDGAVVSPREVQTVMNREERPPRRAFGCHGATPASEWDLVERAFFFLCLQGHDRGRREKRETRR